MMRKPSVATDTKWPERRISGPPTRKANHHADQAGDDGGGQKSKMDRRDPGRQIRQVARFVRVGEREHAGDIGAHGDEAHMAQREDAGEAVASPMEMTSSALTHMTVTTRTR